MDSEEKEDRRKDGSVTFVKIVWTYEFQYRKLLILQPTETDGGTLFV